MVFRVQGSGFRVQGSGFRVQSSRFRVRCSGFRVQGLGLRVQELELNLGARSTQPQTPNPLVPNPQHRDAKGYTAIPNPEPLEQLRFAAAEPSQPFPPRPSTLYPQPSTLDHQPLTLNPHPWTLNLPSSTLNPPFLFPCSPRPSSLIEVSTSRIRFYVKTKSNLNLSGNELCYTVCALLALFKNLCGKLHYHKAVN